MDLATPVECALSNIVSDFLIRDLQGFDVDVPINVGNCGLIYPCPNFDKNPRVFEEVNKCSSKAIEDFNDKHNTDYQFVRVVKVGSQLVSGYNHYITFEAKAKAAAPMYFQALVMLE
ncbi:hypothetical protein RHMOL_Rhmol12G0125400 [Rhododendron molle]|uniref:Uncharacterized protein n=1 Tax=Rhododendron molle TaxID=49168 RepID=A0ACC0LHH7_RHOML|nr:hypothetical protein RHMOL_Rhmol12G0125400 [Rhododendron molle]